MTNNEVLLHMTPRWWMDIESPFNKELVQGLKELKDKCQATDKWNPMQPCAVWKPEEKIWRVNKHHRVEVEGLCRKNFLYFTVVWV